MRDDQSLGCCVHSALALVLALTFAACSADHDTPRVTRRDSARILIVESRAPSWNDAGSWTVDSAPRLSIGVAAGAEEYQFHTVDGVLRLPDGRIVVGDGGSGQLRFYDSTGAFLHAIGRRGHGPGEFGESAMHIWHGAAGELFVEDGGNRRINVFNESGWFVRAVQLERLERSPPISPLALFSDGTIVASAVLPPRDRDSSRVRVQHDQIVYLQFSANGELVSHILRARTSPRYTYTYQEAGARAPLPFGSTSLPAVLGNALAFSSGERTEVHVWSQSGIREGIFRWEDVDRERVDDVWDRFAEMMLERADSGDRESQRHFYSLDLPLPEHVPALERLLADADGNLWAKRWLLPWESKSQWDVLAPGGEWLGTVLTPSGLTVIQIGSDFVLGTHRDDLGVERVRLHALNKPVERRRAAMR